MRPRFVILAGFSVVALSGSQAQAQNYPWCSNFSDGAGSNCGFSTYQQCLATATGSGGVCERNTLYQPPAAARFSSPAAKSRRGRLSRRSSRG